MKYLTFVFSIIISIGTSAQLSEVERVFVLSNYIEDIGVCSRCNKKQYLHAINTILDYQQIEVSPQYTFIRESVGWEKDVSDSIQYSIRFYKICGNNKVGNLFLAHIIDFFSGDMDVWIRLSGWRENDMRFLYSMYKKNGLRERDFKHMVLSWYSVDSIAREAQLDKILEGAIKNEMNDDCFISEHYKLLDSLRHRDMGPTDSKELYSTFSRQPMDGMWVEY